MKVNEIENALIKKAINGNEQAFESLILQYEKRIYAIAFKVFKNEEDSFDVAQEICIKIYKNLHTFQFNSAFSTWIHRLAMNTAIDEYRKRKRKNEHEVSYDNDIKKEEGIEAYIHSFASTEKTPEEMYLQEETKEIVWKCIRNLKKEYEEILVLKEMESKSYKEIAELLDIEIGTVKSRLARARDGLKKEYLKYMEQKDDSFV